MSVQGRSAGIDPADCEVQLGVDLAPGGVVDRNGGQFDDKEDPLHGPAEDEVMNERAGGFGMSEADGEPDAHAADGAEDGGEDEEELGVTVQLMKPVGAELAFRHAHGLALGHRKIKPAADGKLRDHDVEDGDDADHPARAENGNVPEWIVHGFSETVDSEQWTVNSSVGPVQVGSFAKIAKSILLDFMRQTLGVVEQLGVSPVQVSG